MAKSIPIKKKTTPKKNPPKGKILDGFTIEEDIGGFAPAVAFPSKKDLAKSSGDSSQSHEFHFDELFGVRHAPPTAKAVQSVHASLSGTDSANGSSGHYEDHHNADEDDANDITTSELTHVDSNGEVECLFPAANVSKLTPDDFEKLRLIGQGGYGRVFQVRKKSTGEIFAMKVLKKDFLIKTNNVHYTNTEKNALTKVRHPYVVSLHSAFQNERNVYMIMDFVSGGQLLFHLREESMFSEAQAKFYAAQVVLALEHLHSLGIVHRDLKPENILLDERGNLCVTDFGFCKETMNDSANRTHTFCGTLEYMAPEMISGGGYGKSVDWWSVGILIYDMLTGEPPFRSKNEQTLQKKILKDKVKFPSYFTQEAISIVKEFLCRDESQRLGSNGVAEIKAHPFFKGIHWKKLLNLELQPPFRPKLSSNLDVSNFDAEFVNQPITDSPYVGPLLTASQEKLFQGFSYQRPESFSRSPIMSPPHLTGSGLLTSSGSISQL